MVTIKYVFIVLRADNNGEGGTFSTYSLLSRYVRSLFSFSNCIADSDKLVEYHPSRPKGALHDRNQTVSVR